ncbi:MAG: tRNA preQ1(34) S-adenosylmethionine ribosyltransferase-isomerase QueA [Dehalococcoidia bacterium]|nr:tRNA preQ1(34) S-adenosylmethionine ribosyltransferase-isomerase QueA [Dehalococcoidia bacterium]
MLTSDFAYELPDDLVAQAPIEPRDASRLMVLHRATGEIEHRVFHEIGEYLRPGDLLVTNDTRVIPARITGKRKTGGVVELLLLKKRDGACWEALVKPGRVKEGERVYLDQPGRQLPGGDVDLVEVGEECGTGGRVVRFSQGDAVERLGQVPLPPYIHQSLTDGERYQTVFSRVEGSAAAPTAGLHFTPALLRELKDEGVRVTSVTLHIGLDTFRPVKDADPKMHQIHSEYAELGADTAAAISRTRAYGGRVVCVGTTSVRTVEAVAAMGAGAVMPFTGNVNLFILPGFEFKVADAMVTNFHLPRTTLLMLVAAFGSREFILRAYQEAIERNYRFYSFGDAMLIM